MTSYANYTNSKMANTHLIYDLAECNVVLTKHVYQKLNKLKNFLNKRLPNKKTRRNM